MIHPYRNSFSFSEKIFLLSGVTLGAVTFLMAKISVIWLAAYGALTLLYAAYKCTRNLKIDKPVIIEKKKSHFLVVQNLKKLFRRNTEPSLLPSNKVKK